LGVRVISANTHQQRAGNDGGDAQQSGDGQPGQFDLCPHSANFQFNEASALAPCLKQQHTPGAFNFLLTLWTMPVQELFSAKKDTFRTTPRQDLAGLMAVRICIQ
jgi:hypothetical protein